jgi:tripartite-type tricarboxylate transporter receptor subunit TctC
MQRNVLVLMLAGAILLTAFGTAVAAYPDRPIQIVIPYSPGGSTDLLARTMGKVAPKYIPTPWMVVNKPGGSGMPGRLDVLRAKPDGYSVVFGYGSGEDTVLPHLRQLPLDPYKDFEPVCRVSVHTLALVAPANKPWQTVDELVKWVKSQGSAIAAVGTKGGSADITMTAFSKAANINVTNVPGVGGADAATSLAGGHADFGVLHPSELLPHYKAGRLRLYAVAYEERDPTLPAPTLKELGYNVATAGSVKGMAVAKGTPKEIVGYLEEKCKAITEDAEFRQTMKEIGQPVMFMPGQEYLAWLKKVHEQYGQLIKTLGIEVK